MMLAGFLFQTEGLALVASLLITTDELPAYDKGGAGGMGEMDL
jgi:hypothetical protein